MPKGLYARALLIIIAPMVILQSVVAFVFMERHWNLVTRRLSAAVVARHRGADRHLPRPIRRTTTTRGCASIAQDRLGLDVDFLPLTDMPPPGPKPFFSLLDQALSDELRKQIGRPFWIDTVGRSALVEIRIQLDDAVMRVFARRSAAYASNSEIFLLWMVGTSLVLLAVAIAVPAQPDPADPAARRRRRELRQGPRGAGLPAARRARGAPRGARLHRDEDAHRARDRAAHRDAGRRVARPAHRPDPLQARTGAARRQRPRSRR